MVGAKRRFLYFAISAGITTLIGDVVMVLTTDSLKNEFFPAIFFMGFAIILASLFGWIISLLLVYQFEDYSGARWWKFLIIGSSVGPTSIFLIAFFMNVLSTLFSIVHLIIDFNFSSLWMNIWGGIIFNSQLYGIYMLVALGFSIVTCIIYLGFVKNAERKLKSFQ